jgi:cytochrome P450 / NADPH-cytochrome P450 reductase
MTSPTLEPIPHPPGLAFVGNMFDLDSEHPIESLMKLARQYGPIFRLDAPGGPRFIVSGFDLVDELCDESRFDKMLGPGLRQVSRSFARGLFTSETSDPNWRKAHNILLPSFGLQAMQGYLPMMLDLALQLVQKWARLNPDEVIDVPGDMTRLTLDTIGLCGFNYRFNSFYRETPHPFVAAMVRSLEQSQTRSRQLPLQTRLDRRAQRQSARDDAFMSELVRGLIQERRAKGPASGPQDLLGCMLNGVDRQSGEQLDDANIAAQCVTFLVAGHETTSGLLSCVIYFLLKHPEVVARAHDEVDRVFGTDLAVLPTYSQVHQLRYVNQILNETLRLWPTAPAFTRYPYEDAVVGGKYLLPKGSSSTILLPMLHRDPRVWGENAEAFDPDRFTPEREASLPPNSFKPFGTGQRACIGRQFALQEAALVLGMILQRFELIDHLSYELEIKQTLTIKPHGLEIRVRPRAGRTTITTPLLAGPLAAAPAGDLPMTASALPPALSTAQHNTPLLVLYGSNLGTAEGLAQRIAQEAASRGFAATLAALDARVGALPTQGAIVIVVASYNGAPPDNAVKFCNWLRDPALEPTALAGVKYTVFGCGHRDWAATYQAVPALIDQQLAAHGAQRMAPRGEGDGRGDFDGQYRAWYAPLWEIVARELELPASVTAARSSGPRFSLTFTNRLATSPTVTSYQAVAMTVRANRELQRRDGERPSERSTRHLEVALPTGLTYSAGDHLGVLPRNRPELLQRVLQRFKLDASLYVSIKPNADANTHLPVNEPLPLIGILANFVELQDVATRPAISVLAQHTLDPVQREALLALTGDDEAGRTRYQELVLQPRKSLLDLLDDFPGSTLPFEAYLELLPAPRPRYYSISSSPLASPDRCSITVGLVEGPARSGRGVYHGVCSTYLAGRPVDGQIFAFIRPPTIPFRPPENPHTPLIMVGPGTGFAPFRGFLQERAALKERGVPIGESLLFFGCRDPGQDFIYQDELVAFEAAGITRLHAAFSRLPGQPKTYVQQAIAEQREEVWRLLQQGAAIYVCGDANRMAPDVRRAFATIFQQQTGTTEVDAQAWLTGLMATNRYLEDIWGGGA